MDSKALAEAIKQALLRTSPEGTYMEPEAPLDRFLIDGEIDLVAVAEAIGAGLGPPKADPA